MRSPITVLIADDQLLFASALEAVLAGDERFRVVGRAADGAQAVELAETLAPDVVLMDISMPRVDGLQAARKLRDSAATARVIMLTESDMRADVVRAEQAGAAGYVAKTRIGIDLTDAILAVAGSA
jgi:DNA-binding NarL/FixJ family response regulator